jgi:uncharacterized membrane protein YphA (DoxX/SURF4 family)
VYVLSPEAIHYGLTTPAFSAWDVVTTNRAEFLFWTFVAVLLVFIVFFVSISRVVEAALDPFLRKLRPYAPVVSRVTIGLSFLAAAYYQAVFGPELPIAATFPGVTSLVSAVLVIVGTLITLGIYTRQAALAALAVFLVYVHQYGWYMLTYTNYLGEIVVLLILGGHRIGLHAHAERYGRGLRGFAGKVAERLAPYSFVLLRIAFGVSLLYASIYAKFIHNQLALSVASTPLAGHAATLAANLGGFEPHFLVLGAGIVEIVIGLFFLLGLEIRFTALFLEFWLTLSLVYFGEIVWPHLILIGIPIAFLFYGYDRYSLEGFFFKHGDREPVL